MGSSICWIPDRSIRSLEAAYHPHRQRVFLDVGAAGACVPHRHHLRLPVPSQMRVAVRVEVIVRMTLRVAARHRHDDRDVEDGHRCFRLGHRADGRDRRRVVHGAAAE